MRQLIFFFALLLATSSSAQVPSLYSMHTQWDDNIAKWDVLTVDEDQSGTITMVWEALNRIDEWEFSFEGVYGKIKLKPLGNKEQWELRIGNEVVTIRQQWPNDLTEWRITDNSITIDFKAPDRSDPFNWQLKQSDRFGKFHMYSEYEDDIRDWVIVDELDPSFNFAMKIAMVFVPIIPALPRERR